MGWRQSWDGALYRSRATRRADQGPFQDIVLSGSCTIAPGVVAMRRRHAAVVVVAGQLVCSVAVAGHLGYDMDTDRVAGARTPVRHEALAATLAQVMRGDRWRISIPPSGSQGRRSVQHHRIDRDSKRAARRDRRGRKEGGGGREWESNPRRTACGPYRV